MTSYLLFMYRQNGSDRIMGATADAQGDWRDGSFEMTYNPVTNKQWSASEVNAGLEWGFRSWFPQLTPRVTQSYLEVTYRVPTESTVYIGGVYEEKDDGSVTKYYSLNGRPVALRKVGAGGGAGTLFYLLGDHLGSTVELLNSGGVTVPNSEVEYWPYGALRSGGITQTDKLYTGQQQEPGDAALGLYNYKARFYSTVLGRFVSADPIEGLNRYAYVRNNPSSYVDPTGFECKIYNPDPEECRKAAEEIVDDVVDVGRGVVSEIGSISQATWEYLAEQINKIKEWAHDTAVNIWNAAKNNARSLWRQTYHSRSPFTRALEGFILADVFTSRAYQEIRTISGGLALDAFGVQFPVALVIGCTSGICQQMAALGNEAFTIGHTIFFTTWDLARIEENPNRFFQLWAHEMEHVAQFEDWGDAFWIPYYGEGFLLLAWNCLRTSGCNVNDVWHRQWLEETADDHTYP